jgi:hypothetical protein
MTTPPGELLDFLHRQDPDVRTLTLMLRDVVLEEMAPCHEYIFTMGRRVVLLYGPTSRVIEDCVCMIGVYRQHANLQFTHGVELADPHGLLEGTGKRMRHLKIKAPSDLARQEIREFLRQARKNAGMARRLGKAGEVITKVKSPKVGSSVGSG